MNNTGSVDNTRAVVVDTNSNKSAAAQSATAEPAKVEGDGGKNLPLSTQSNSPPKDLEDSTDRQGRNQRVEKAVERLNDYAQSFQRDLRFSVDEELGRSVISVVDRNTQELIRQIPNETALELARNLNDYELQAQSQRLQSKALDAQGVQATTGNVDGGLGLVNIRI